MSFVDMAVGTAFFIFFIALVLLVTVQHFVRYPVMVAIEEYREKAVSLFEQFFTTLGIPCGWEDSGIAPSKLGLSVKMYVRPILVRELGTSSRQNEPVFVKLIFDEECENKTWNNTVRIYDSNLTKTKYEFVNPVFCTGQYLNESYVRLNVNVSLDEEKTFFVYYYESQDVPSPNHTMVYSTGSWVPASGDSWSDDTASWSRYGGATGSPENENTIKLRGDNSIKINGTFDSQTLGLAYDPASLINGVSNGWYVDAWVHLTDMTGISGINVSVSDGSETIMTYVNTSGLIGGQWYHLERELNDTQWDGWSSFNASDGIDNVSFFMLNFTPGITRQLIVDEVHFELEPLDIEVFPEDRENIVSSKKISALHNITYEELREIIGEDYRFRIEITESG